MLVRLCVIVVLPILASTAMALHDGWTPVGDNATLALRAGDVLRGHAPLTGMVTTADTITDAKELDHPGPLEVWVAAVPYAVFGPAGLLVTIAAINAAALVLSVLIGWRRGKAPLAIAITATGLVLCWSLGTTVIRDPLNSHVELLPWFLLVLLCWDVRLGHWRSLPLAVLAASWVVQAHVVYTPMTLILGAGTAVLCSLDHRHRSDEARRRFGEGRRQALIWSVTLGLVLSLPMLIDQFTGSGNLGKMFSFAGQRGQGLGVAVRAIGTSLGLPPAWLQPVNEPFVLLRGPSLLDVIWALVTIGLITWVLVSARRRRDRLTLTLVQAALVSLAAAAFVVYRTPRGGAVLAADPMLLLRPVTATVWLATGWGLWAMVADRVTPRLQDQRAHLVTAVVGSVAALALVAATVLAPGKFGGYGEGLMGPIASIQPKIVSSVEGQRMVEVNASGWAARLYLRHAVIEDLERHGIHTETSDDDRVFRRPSSKEGAHTATLYVVSDPIEPKAPDPDAFLIARADLVPGGGLSTESQRRIDLRSAIDEAGRVELKDSSRVKIADVSREFFRWTTPPPQGQADLPSDWVSVDSFVELQRHGLIASPKVPDALVDQIQADSVGRFFAAEDMEVAIYLKLS
ncbi:hypothetical protein [Aquihabitans sp. McL0605]|uniref:hypothetical protein n=1 Tax=Aquihabitans sp. McL0605 TaxID=3415671 RepID=UPI003CF40F04